MIGATSFTYGPTTNTTFITHQSLQAMSTVVQRVVENFEFLDLLQIYYFFM